VKQFGTLYPAEPLAACRRPSCVGALCASGRGKVRTPQSADIPVRSPESRQSANGPLPDVISAIGLVSDRGLAVHQDSRILSSRDAKTQSSLSKASQRGVTISTARSLKGMRCSLRILVCSAGMIHARRSRSNSLRFAFRVSFVRVAHSQGQVKANRRVEVIERLGTVMCVSPSNISNSLRRP
jgi:hypothetical protein